MTGYYELKRRAFIDIDRYLKMGKSKEWIIKKIQISYGFGYKVVEERIAILEEVGDLDE